MTARDAAHVEQTPAAGVRAGLRAGPALAVWALWRVVHGMVVAVSGGGLVDRTLSWDGGWYLSVLEGGYRLPDPTLQTQQNVAFMPLVTFLAEPFDLLLSSRSAAVVAANLASLFAFVAVHEAARRWWDDRGALVVLAGLALWPFSLFLWTFYSEAMFVGIVAVGFVGVADRRPALVAAAALLAPMTRPVGIVFGGAVGLVALLRDRRLSAAAVGPVLAAVAGLGAVVAIQHVSVGDGLAFFHAQGAWDREIDLPWLPIREAVRAAGSALPTIALEPLSALAAIVLGAVAVAVLARRRLWDDQPEVFAYAALLFVATQFTVLFTSQARFALATFPLLLALRPLPRAALVALGAGAAATSVFTLAVWSNGTFIG